MNIVIENVSKVFGDTVVLDDVNLSIQSGSLTALLGPSGCGKTTLLRIIAGLESAEHGVVRMDGTAVNEWKAQQRGVGFVFQHYALFRHLNVFENVAFGLRVKPRQERPSESQIKAKVNELLELVQLTQFARHVPAQLSGGQRQRIALARALAVEPKILLLDEPFGALDARVRKELRSWLRQLHDELHITSVFVTHDQEEALEVSDQIVVMNRGKIEQVGEPQWVYNHPQTPFVFSFLGNVNTFRGRVEGHSLHIGEHVLPIDEAIPSGVNEAVAFARPYEVELHNGTDGPGLPARVRRLQQFGPVTRVELETVYDSSRIEAQVNSADLGDLDLRQDKLVTVSTKQTHLYPIDKNGEWQI